MGQPVECFLLDLYVELGFEPTWGRVLSCVFFLCFFFAYTKTHTIFFLSVIWGFVAF